MPAVDVIVSSGDVVSGPLPAESLRLPSERPGVRFVLGNADLDVRTVDETVTEATAERLHPIDGGVGRDAVAGGHTARRKAVTLFERTVTELPDGP